MLRPFPISLVVLAGSAALALAEPRLWTSRKGTTLEAELLKADETSATLVTKDTKQVVLKIEDLSLADRQYLVEYASVDPKALVSGTLGLPEKEARIDSKTIVKLKDKALKFGDDSRAIFELVQSEHFLIASAGDVRAQAVAETAERLWHGMAFQHMNFRQDWGDKRMLIILAEDRGAYEALGTWWVQQLENAGEDIAVVKTRASWQKVGGTSISLTPEMMSEYNVHDRVSVFNVTDGSRFKKVMGPFQIHMISGALLGQQMGGVSSYGAEGYFAVTTGHSYFKEIQLGGKSETQILAPGGVDDNNFSSKSGFEDGTSWTRTLRTLVRKGDVKPEIDPMFKWTANDLTPERLVLIYSFSYYMQSTPQRLSAYATMIRRIESSNQIPAPVEIARIFGFEDASALEADWTTFIKEGDFK